MMNLANSNNSDFQQTQQMSSQKAEILQQNYNTLQEESKQIEQMIREYETLNSAYENEQINVTSNYYRYIIYVIIVIFLIFLLLKFSVTTEQRGGGNFTKFSPFIFGLLGFIIVFNAILKN